MRVTSRSVAGVFVPGTSATTYPQAMRLLLYIHFLTDEESRQRWRDVLGVSHHHNDSSVSVARFPPHNLSAKGIYPPIAGKLRIAPRSNAGRTLWEDDMLKAPSGALERATRLEVVVVQHVQEHEVEMVRRQKQELRMAEVETKLALSKEERQQQLADRQESGPHDQR